MSTNVQSTLSFCADQLNWVLVLSVTILALAMILGVWSAVTKSNDRSADRTIIKENVAQIGVMLTALKELIEALKNAPAWFALFLAGVGLFWVASEKYVEACKPAAPVVKTTTEKIQKTEITKIIK